MVPIRNNITNIATPLLFWHNLIWFARTCANSTAYPSLIINHKAERRWEINYPIGQKMGENLNKINKKGRIRWYGLFGVRRRIRTADLQSRSLTLYPAGLYVLVVFLYCVLSRRLFAYALNELMLSIMNWLCHEFSLRSMNCPKGHCGGKMHVSLFTIVRTNH